MSLQDIINSIAETDMDINDYAIQIARECTEFDSIAMMRIQSSLVKAGATKGFVNEWARGVRKYKKQISSAFFEKVDVEKGASWPYAIEDGRMVYLSASVDGEGFEQVSSKPIADMRARIVSEAINPDTGGKRYTVAGESLRGGKFSFTVDAGLFDKEREMKSIIGAQAGATAPIYWGMGGHIPAAIKLLSDANEIDKEVFYERVGWTDSGDFLVPGIEPPGTTINIHSSLPFQFDEDSNLEMGMQCLNNLLKFSPAKSAPVLASLFMAPLMRPSLLSNERCITFVVGMTNSFKTSFMKAAMSLYGPDFSQDHRLIKWGEGATRNSIMRLAGESSDMPLLIDNYKPGTGGGAKSLIAIAHNIVEGTDKLRSRPDGTLRPSNPLHCMPVFTGEDIPSTDPATLARMVVVRFVVHAAADTEERAYLTEAQAQSMHLNAVGKSWIEWLQSEEGQENIKGAYGIFVEKRLEWSKHLSRKYPDARITARIASNLAVLETAWVIMMSHPVLGSVAEEYHGHAVSGLAESAKFLIEGTNESIEAVRFISHIKELVAANRVTMASSRESFVQMDSDEISSRNVIGWFESDGSANLLPNLSMQSVIRHAGDDLNNITLNTLNRQLFENDYIGKMNKGKLYAVRIKGSVHAVINIKPDVLRGSEYDAEDIPLSL